ncbi:MAG: MATE family efflux transporter [Clostridia bacterium]|nr:MATE family efflux transporter [Clostridia bacterium]
MKLKTVRPDGQTPFPWRSFLRQLMAIGIPVALQNVLTTTASMVDTIMLATVGELTVGAVGLCAQFTSLMFSCYWGFVGGGMLFFSQFWGAKDDDGINRSYGLTLICMMAVGLTFGLLGTLFPEAIMRVYTDKAAIREIGVRYLRIVGFAYPLQVLAMAMSALLRSTERVRIPLIASIAALVTNLAVNWLLIFGHFGFPALGVQGAAIATLLSAIVNVLVIVALAARAKHPYLLRVREHFRFDRALTKEYFVKCFPIICNELLIGISNMAINMVLGRQIEQAIVATAVFRTLEGFVIGFFSGFTNASTVLVGKCVGSGDHETAFARAKRLIPLCPCVIFCACMLLVSLRSPLLHAMGLQGESYEICVRMLLIYTVFGSIRMTNWIQNDTFRAAGDPYFGTIREIAFAYLMMLPCVISSGIWLKLPFLVVFACTYIDEPVRLVLMLRHTLSARWIRPVTVEGQKTIAEFRQKYVK